MKVERYDEYTCGVVGCTDGEYVKYCDYDALLSLNAELLEAATTVFDGLNERIDMAVASGSPLPVYEGIAALHDAIAKARSAS